MNNQTDITRTERVSVSFTSAEHRQLREIAATFVPVGHVSTVCYTLIKEALAARKARKGKDAR